MVVELNTCRMKCDADRFGAAAIEIEIGKFVGGHWRISDTEQLFEVDSSIWHVFTNCNLACSHKEAVRPPFR
jgi:hypothetical protein